MCLLPGWRVLRLVSLTQVRLWGGDLHTGRLVIVEGAAHGTGWSGFQAVVGKDRGDGEGGFDLGDGHRLCVGLSFLFN